MGFHSVCKVIISPVHSHARNPVENNTLSRSNYIIIYTGERKILPIPGQGSGKFDPMLRVGEVEHFSLSRIIIGGQIG